jgi:RNA recognition motif-containing protein
MKRLERQTRPSSTVWMGNLDGFEDENYLRMIFFPMFNISSIKLFKDTNGQKNYAFLEFDTSESAQSAMEYFNGKPRPLSRRFSK